MSKKGEPNRSPHLLLAKWFVVHIIGREWTEQDFRGQHLKRASELLKRYAFNDIVGALKAFKDGVLNTTMVYDLTDLSVIEKLEPPLLEQWQDYKSSEPPFWLEADHKLWKELTSADYLAEWSKDGVPMPEGGMRSGEDSDPTGRTGRGESMAPQRLSELHTGKRIPSGDESGSDLPQS